MIGERGMASHVDRWLRRWESMMDGYLPGRGDLMMAGMHTAETVLGRPPARVLDLGGGPGGTTRKLLRRWPACEVSLLDLDPVLLALAQAAAPAAAIQRADIGTARWRLAAGGPYDLVLAVMTLHYFPAGRVRQLYAEIRRLLQPGGLVLVAEPMPERALPARRDRPDGPDPWQRWWSALAGHPAMARLMQERAQVMAGRHSAEFVASSDWHHAAARDAGYAESWLAWHRDDHALLAARNT
jgi:SAM-dependent methyltransferase